MRYIALEEAFFIPELAERQPTAKYQQLVKRMRPEWAQRCQLRLPDFGDHRLAEMDDAGIDIQVLSLTSPGLQIDIGAEQARDNARFANEYLAKVIGEHPDRFRGFAALPMQDPAAAAAELERAVTQDGFCGALVNDCITGPGGRYLDAPEYDVVWSAVESLGVPLYLHPGSPPADQWQVIEGRPELYGATWSWAAEVGGHALRILFGGVFDRHPGATLILGHMGEFLPFQRSRLDSRFASTSLSETSTLRRAPSAYLGTNIVFTNSGVFSPAAMLGAVLEVGADALMFSIDYPYESSYDAVRGFEQTTLPAADREKIAHGNAERLLRI
ncbi:Predicted metal-dependent hydrolase, TIM-barrel fold [Mycobacterium rhizamassiliense]|jgi:2,3-dihydroxybenzoate decarboxylase|uniref:Predicted metal-dependent hydrolase, TIM-barrel fold n=1 Tax=Mycobacterium rhizamassiliense TaxID=1841860 RepID=A0A2U3NPV2_9MYCO|nr:amidohydrolase family protein [Mycobacterium rhizamassiliense]SPM33546.1 Predicted metal-dependent hydrolase, TIM-barrel fold [Mycobacterium rhizamassiliense]